MHLGRIFAAAALATTLGVATPARDAAAATYNINWIGPFGTSMTGQFSFANALVGTGPIDETALASFTISVFDGGGLEGSWSLGDAPDPNAGAFNFNFDTTTGAFLFGGAADSPTGQNWNYVGPFCTGAGFRSAAPSEEFCSPTVGGGYGALTASQLTATRVDTPIPLPASLGLLLAGLAGLSLVRRSAA